MKNRHAIAALSLLALFPSIACAQQDSHGSHSSKESHGAKLGRVTFDNSGNAQAQRPFLVGLALLHSFEYDQAADSFRVAQKRDPKFALAYWMEAFTNSKLIWGLEDRDAARTRLAGLAPTAARRISMARTSGERAFGAAVESFYGSTDKTEARVDAFAESMQRWAGEKPNDHEARAFAALGIIWQAFFADDAAVDSLNREAVQHAQFVFDRNSQHPGAAHYVIHASDSPAGAQRGLRAAREYSRIAPDAGHALHMPSHIFLPLGLWEDMVQSNERAWASSRASTAAVNGATWDNDWHSFNWLQYAYLQLGRWKDARALIDTARALTAGMKGKVSPAVNSDAAFAVEALAFRYGSETGDWSEMPAESIPLSPLDSGISQRARTSAFVSIYRQGAVAALKGDSVRARAAMKVASSSRLAFADMIEVALLSRTDRAGMIRKLEALRPTMRVDRNSSMLPSSLINPFETLGAALVEEGRAREAIEVYRQALEDRPRRAASMLGLARAQAAAGDEAGARKTYAELAAMWSKADPTVRATARSQR